MIYLNYEISLSRIFIKAGMQKTNLSDAAYNRDI